MVGVLVTVHELGHFIAAKLLRIKVLRFSIGFGPAIARIKGKDTEYQLGAVPLGGYVRLLGEDPSDPVAEADVARSFSHKPLWRRLVVVFAGPAANMLAPLIIYFAFYAGHTELPAATIGDVFAGGPAAEAGIRPGDRVVEINGAPVRYWEELEKIVDGNTGKMLRFRVRRGDQLLYTYVAPRRHTIRHRNGQRSEQGLIGVTQAPFQPQIGVLDTASPAARAGLRTGDLVVSVSGEPIASFSELTAALQRHAKRASIAYLRSRRAAAGFADLELHEAGIADLVPDVAIDENGRRTMLTGIVSAEFFVSSVEPDSPAAEAGLAAGDLITTLDGRPVTHWVLFDQALQAEPERAWRIGWLRAEGGAVTAHEAELVQRRTRVVDEYGADHDHLLFGAANDFQLGQGEMVPIEGRFLYAAGHAVDRTGTTVVEMVRGFAAIIRGDKPRDVGGPIMVYRMASVSGAKGWDEFLLMIALISVNLGLINLLPIPILDGGHLVIFAMEGVRRRRLSPRVREAVVFAGLLVIVSLTVLALRNDIVRYLMR